jgi:hypothetical protein
MKISLKTKRFLGYFLRNSIFLKKSLTSNVREFRLLIQGGPFWPNLVPIREGNMQRRYKGVRLDLKYNTGRK